MKQSCSSLAVSMIHVLARVIERERERDLRQVYLDMCRGCRARLLWMSRPEVYLGVLLVLWGQRYSRTTLLTCFDRRDSSRVNVFSNDGGRLLVREETIRQEHRLTSFFQEIGNSWKSDRARAPWSARRWNPCSSPIHYVQVVVVKLKGGGTLDQRVQVGQHRSSWLDFAITGL